MPKITLPITIFGPMKLNEGRMLSMTFPTNRQHRTTYEGSMAERMDRALLQGGTWREIASNAHVQVFQVRAHARYRQSTGRAQLVIEGDTVRLVPNAEPR